MSLYRKLRDILRETYAEGEASAICFMLFEEICSLSRTDVLMGRDDELDDEKTILLEKFTKRIAEGEPVQYVIGHTSFCGLKINVKPGVLIPRPETEELVEWIQEEYSNIPANRITSPVTPPHILDIGCGSGCIALALASSVSNAKVDAWDISDKALEIAKENAATLGIKATFIKRDALEAHLLEEEKGAYSTIVSNPPYICESERKDMEKNVLEHEPETALFVPDTDPLLFYREITTKATHLLANGGTLYFETNRMYAKEVSNMMLKKGFSQVEIRKDFMGNERMVKGTFQH